MKFEVDAMLFTELRIKESKKVHDSGYSCFEITGYNAKTKEELPITTWSDVIHLPSIKSKFEWESHLSIDKHPNKDYWRIFVTSSNLLIKVTGILSDFRFEVIEVDKNAK